MLSPNFATYAEVLGTLFVALAIEAATESRRHSGRSGSLFIPTGHRRAERLRLTAVVMLFVAVVTLTGDGVLMLWADPGSVFAGWFLLAFGVLNPFVMLYMALLVVLLPFVRVRRESAQPPPE